MPNKKEAHIEVNPDYLDPDELDDDSEDDGLDEFLANEGEDEDGPTYEGSGDIADRRNDRAERDEERSERFLNAQDDSENGR